MRDERQDSIRQGIGVPPESPIGREAEEEARQRAATGPQIGGGMGGTSDVDSPGTEAQADAARAAAEEDEEDIEAREAAERRAPQRSHGRFMPPD